MGIDNNVIPKNGRHYIEGRGADIAENDTDGDKHSCRGYPIDLFTVHGAEKTGES